MGIDRRMLTGMLAGGLIVASLLLIAAGRNSMLPDAGRQRAQIVSELQKVNKQLSETVKLLESLNKLAKG